MRAYKVKFSYGLSRGTALHRREISKAMSLSIADRISSQNKNNSTISVRNLERVFKKFMPEKIFFNIKKMSDKESEGHGALFHTILSEDLVARYSIRMFAEQNAVDLADIPSLAHESTHLFDYLFSPKTIKTIEKVNQKDLDALSDNLYALLFYSAGGLGINENISMFKLKRTITKELKDLSNDDKISVLKYLKEGLETEVNAYSTEDICANMLIDKGKESYYSPYDEIESIYKFNKKIKLLKKMIYETISQSRYINAMDNAKTPMDKLKLTLNYCLKSLI